MTTKQKLIFWIFSIGSRKLEKRILGIYRKIYILFLTFLTYKNKGDNDANY